MIEYGGRKHPIQGAFIVAPSGGTDSTGGSMPDASQYTKTYTYDGDGNPTTASFSDGTSTWTKTYTWVGGNMTTETAWVKS